MGSSEVIPGLLVELPVERQFKVIDDVVERRPHFVRRIC